MADYKNYTRVHTYGAHEIHYVRTRKPNGNVDYTVIYKSPTATPAVYKTNIPSEASAKFFAWDAAARTAVGTATLYEWAVGIGSSDYYVWAADRNGAIECAICAHGWDDPVEVCYQTGRTKVVEL